MARTWVNDPVLTVIPALLTTLRPGNRSRDSCDPIGVVPHRQRGAVQRAGLEDQRGGILSKFGPQTMPNTLVLLWCVFGVLEL